jgi:hypothetical protein
MGGFVYNRISSSRINSYRNFIAFGGTGRQSYVGYFDLQNSLGNQSIAGVGFQPEFIILFGIEGDFFGDTTPGNLGLGAATSSSNQWAGSLFCQHNNYTWSATRTSNWSSNRIITSAQLGYDAQFVSFDANGFTLNVTNAPSVVKRYVYLALKGGGSYRAGTNQSRTTVGTQSISGLGFQPTAIFTANGPVSLGAQNDAYMGFGAGDTTNQYSVWAGSRRGSAQLASYYSTGNVVTFGLGAVYPTPPTVLNQANLGSFDADGFTLNWHTVDGTARYYHWVAFSGEVDVGRFLFPNTTADQTVSTTTGPIAIMGYGNDMESDGFENVPSSGWSGSVIGSGLFSYGSSLGLSACNSDGTIEYSASYGDNYPVTLSITASRRDLATGSFGAFKNNSRGNDNSMRNKCNVKTLISNPSPFIGPINLSRIKFRSFAAGDA